MAWNQAAGVAPRDMQTQGLSVQPRWSRQTDNAQAAPRITGFVARNGVRARIRVLDDLGSILNAVVEDGANTLDGLQFSVADTNAALAEARAEVRIGNTHHGGIQDTRVTDQHGVHFHRIDVFTAGLD